MDTRALLFLALPEETLNSLIQSCTCRKTLKSLLQVKHQRIEQGSSEKLNFSIDCIYLNVGDTDLCTQILKTALQVARNSDTHVSQAVNYCLDKLCSSPNLDEISHCLNLFNTVLERFISEKSQFILSQHDFDRFLNAVVAILNGQSKPPISFILVHIIPNFVSAGGAEDTRQFLAQIFDKSVKKEKKLETLCVCYETFMHKTDFNLIKSEEFWFLLMDCLTQQQYLKRQAVFLLSKSIDVIAKVDKSQLATFLQTDEKTWRDYLLLLDASNEKQLHLVEPSLCVLSSVMSLHFLWRSCLYKIFLSHPQDAIVYSTAIFVLRNETEWAHFSKIIAPLLRAINRNEYSAHSVEVFEKLGELSSELRDDQFEFLLSESLDVPWVPAAIWSFYSNIFNARGTSFRFSPTLLDGMIRNLKLIPHKYVRKGCAHVVSNFFMKNCCIDGVDDVLKVSRILRNSGTGLLEKFLGENDEQIRRFRDELAVVVKNEECERDATLQQLMTSSNFSEAELEEMVLNGIEDGRQGQHVVDLILKGFEIIEDGQQVGLFRGPCSKKVLDKASDVLGQHADRYNIAQKYIAFEVLHRHDKMSVTDFWDKFLKADNTDEHITQLFVETLVKAFSNERALKGFITILDNILDRDSKATITILANFATVSKSVDITTPFIEKCLGKFSILIKTCEICKSTSEKIFGAMFDFGIENDEYWEKVVGFSQSLLEGSNGANSVAYILSDHIDSLARQRPIRGAMFVPVIVDLFLRGIIVNKNERVEYYICQEMRRILPDEYTREYNNPNFEQKSTSLLALNSMLHIAEYGSSDDINRIISLLMEKYRRYFSKRYFPDSLIHIEKLRILQALVLIIKNTNTEHPTLVEMIIESFTLETHQPSVKLLLQFLLILLTRKDSKSIIETICKKLKTIDNNRPSTVTGLIPVLFYLVSSQDETVWDQLVEILLPYTMGAQFKLRIYAQVALQNIYLKAIVMNHDRFLNKYRYLDNSLAEVIEATSEANYDVPSIQREFFDFSIENCNCSTILYAIPKKKGVTEIEWENLARLARRYPLLHISFSHPETDMSAEIPKNEIRPKHNERIQKKITPWKEMLNSGTDDRTNGLILVTTLIEKPANLGGLARTCEVFGTKKVVMRTSKITSDKEFQSLSMSSENWIDIAEVKAEDLLKFILDVKKQGYSVIGAEQTSDSAKLDRFRFPERTVLILGNEKKGIPADLIPLLDRCIEIPQFGMVRSLNVHVAGAIAMWEYCKQHKL